MANLRRGCARRTLNGSSGHARAVPLCTGPIRPQLARQVFSQAVGVCPQSNRRGEPFSPGARANVPRGVPQALSLAASDARRLYQAPTSPSRHALTTRPPLPFLAPFVVPAAVTPSTSSVLGCRGPSPTFTVVMAHLISPTHMMSGGPAGMPTIHPRCFVPDTPAPHTWCPSSPRSRFPPDGRAKPMDVPAAGGWPGPPPSPSLMSDASPTLRYAPSPPPSLPPSPGTSPLSSSWYMPPPAIRTAVPGAPPLSDRSVVLMALADLRTSDRPLPVGPHSVPSSPRSVPAALRRVPSAADGGRAVNRHRRAARHGPTSSVAACKKATADVATSSHAVHALKKRVGGLLWFGKARQSTGWEDDTLC